MEDQALTIVILAAGLGTRMKSKKAKVLHRAGGITLVENVVQSALKIATPENVFVVTGHQADEVEAILKPYGVTFFRQLEQKGTGHAMLMGESMLSERKGRLIVLYGDTPLLSDGTLQALLERDKATRSAATVITTILEDPTGYGRIVMDDSHHIIAIVEQKAATLDQYKIKEINSGIYSFDSALLWKYIHTIKPNNPAKEYYLTDMIEILRHAGHHAVTLRVEDPSELLGINSRVELAVADKILRDRKSKELMLDGVTIEYPETVQIDRQVKVGPDTIVGPLTQLRGNTVIGEDCYIGAGCIIEDSTIEDGVEVHPYSIINKSVVESGSHIGPFARLRQDNHIEQGVHIGNFVELKNTRMGAGAKARHLSYLGDATIGEKSNIGAGTITCNYDGKKKAPTRIGRETFVGSNSTLVAPLTLGDESYVGAGSVVTEEVPADALALGRARQVNKEGYAKKLREQD